jgi:colicin import membrane protein
MTTLAAPRDALLPRPPKGMGAGALLALLVHGGLIVAIAFGVNWKASEPAGIEAELWASVPQVAAPQVVAPKVEPQPAPPPPPKVEARPEPRVETPDPQIAIEREKKERQKRLDEERERQEQADKLAKAKAEREKLERDRREKAERDKREEAAIAAARDAQLKRMQELAGGTGAPTSTGTAAQTAGPSAGYAGRIKARIKPNVVFTDSVPGNPVASVEVRAAADGTIVGRRLVRSSGVPAWDEAVLRAIDKTEVLPRDTDGRVPGTMLIDFRPRD